MNSQLKFVLLGCATAPRQFTPTFARDAFEVHTLCQIVNGCVSAVQSGQLEMLNVLGPACDSLMLRAKLLQESLIHAGTVSDDELVSSFLVQLVGVALQNPLGPAAEQQAADKHAEYIRLYQARLQQAGKELMVNCSNAQQMAEMLNSCAVPMRGAPIWFICGYTPQDHIVNDMWIPERWAQPLMRTITEEQAKALSVPR